jgi:hypothetical protein
MTATKLLDCWTTARKITYAGHESNPITRVLMARLGTHRAIWAVFLISLTVIVTTTAWTLHFIQVDQPGHTRTWLQTAVGWGFILYGAFASTVQTAVAHANHTGRQNRVTRGVLVAFGMLGRLRSWLRPSR